MDDLKRELDEAKMRVLRKLVSQSGNRQCFDCLQKGPTYVNTSIGSFVCTKCSGLLRGLTPPHRVKSISMARFTPQEIELLKLRGNSYCKRVWLGLCDDNRINEPKNEQQVKDFMVEKYEKKRFYLEPSPEQSPDMQSNGSQSLLNGYNQHYNSNQNLNEFEDIISLSNGGGSSMKKSTTSNDSLFFDQNISAKSLSIDNILSLSSFSSSSPITNDNSSNEFNADFSNADIFVSPQLSSNDLISVSSNGHSKDAFEIISINSSVNDINHMNHRNGMKQFLSSNSSHDDSNSNSSEDRYAALKDLDMEFKQSQQLQLQHLLQAPEVDLNQSSISNFINDSLIENVNSDKISSRNPFLQDQQQNPFRNITSVQTQINGFYNNLNEQQNTQITSNWLSSSKSLNFKSIIEPNPFKIDINTLGHKKNPFL